jgi:hypothetical protein
MPEETPPAAWDLRVLAVLQERDGVETLVDLEDGSRRMVWDIAWGYDMGDEYSHVTTNISPGAPGRPVDSFFTNEVVALVDPVSGSALLRNA